MPDATMRETDGREAAQVFGPSRWWSAAARQRFVAAMQPVLALRHPNLVGTLAVSERGDTVVILSEDVAGVTLEAILAAEPVQSIAAIASILTQVAMALEHAHAAGLAHGAVRSSSVLIDENGDARVADMGVVAALSAAGVHGEMDESASPAYASPEVLRGESPSAPADQYALGALAYELLAGRGPLEASESWLRRAQLRWHPDSMDLSSHDVPEEWSRAVKRMLDKRPANRFASVTEAVRVFARANEGQDQRFRGPLGWIVKQQMSGAMPLEDDEEPDAAGGGRSPFASIEAPIVDVMEQRVRDAVLRHAPRISARGGGVRRRTLAVAACTVLVGALAWSATPRSTRDRLQSGLELEVSQLGNPRTAVSTITAAPPAGFAADPLAAARQPADSLSTSDPAPVAPSPPRREQPPAAAPVPSPNAAARVPHAESRPRKSRPGPREGAARPHQRVELATKLPPVQARASVPVVVTSMGAPPGPSSPSVPAAPPRSASLSADPSSLAVPVGTASAMSPEAAAAAPPPPSPQALSAAEAGNAARAVIGLLGSANVHSLSASMIPSQVDEAFVDWLARRPVGLDVGTPPAPRIVQTADGGAQVRYIVPITWTHASGARPTRTATVLVAVRPTVDGAPVVAWSLAQPFVP